MREFSPGVHKLVKHLGHLQRMAEGEVVAPIHVSIWPTIRCNFNCSYCCCKNTLRDSKDLDVTIYKKAIDVLSQYGTKAVEISGGGEPLLWESFSEAVDYTVSKSLKISLITNGVFLKNVPQETLNKLSWVRISYQSENHAKFIDYSKLQGIKHSGSFIVTDDAERIGELVKVSDFCEENKITVRVAVERPCSDDFEEMVRGIVTKLGNSFTFFSDKQHGSPDGCYMPWIRAAIDWEGNFLPCPSMHLSEEFRGFIPDKFKLCHVNELESWLMNNPAHDLGFRCSTCNCGKENNDFYHQIISDVTDQDFV